MAGRNRSDGIWRNAAIIAALTFFPTNEVVAAGPDSDLSLGEFRSGSWTGKAYYQGDTYTFGPRYVCEISGVSVRYVQIRPPETPMMEARWEFEVLHNQHFSNATIDKVIVGERGYQVVRLPWRLARPPKPGNIVMTVDALLFAFRSSREDEWLPFEYLTPTLMQAGEFKVAYSYEDEDGERRTKALTVNMLGFREVAKWCGKQLLSDRLGEERVKELTD